MPQIRFYAEHCKGCGLCVLVCPHQNIRISEDLNEHGHPFAVLADPARCTYCALCGRMCPDTAIEIIEGKNGPQENSKEAAE
ncbi:MAG: ferredoxin family protein [Anaerohalosphaeraceae bacterium]